MVLYICYTYFSNLKPFSYIGGQLFMAWEMALKLNKHLYLLMTYFPSTA